MAQHVDDSHDAKRKVANRTELNILRAILDHIERGEQIINLNQLARYIDRTKAVVSPALDNLEEMGFITSVKTEGGKRRTRTIRVANAPRCGWFLSWEESRQVSRYWPTERMSRSSRRCHRSISGE
jgi:DNA-binding transcriptional MocR family regulator